MCVVTPGPSRQPANINSNEIISNNTVNQVDDNSDSSLFTPAQNCRNVITVQAQVHMPNSPAPCHSRITKKVPLISTNRVRQWRAKKEKKSS
jgi:hypothetical protein